MSELDCIQSLSELLGPYSQVAEQSLERWVTEPGTPEELGQAMRYCVLNGGKRLRPSLALMACEAVGDGQALDTNCQGQANEVAKRAAIAVELVHCYSLVHDDLPAMDDDDLRRGRPTAHVKFGQALAILAGDALLTRAFAVLTECRQPQSALLVSELAKAAGSAGMVAGQVGDMDLCQVPEGREGLDFIYLRKTGFLIRASARMGAICADANDEQLLAVSNYAESIGLALQAIEAIRPLGKAAAKLRKLAELLADRSH